LPSVVRKLTALDAYVNAVILVGVLCTVWLTLDGSS
jgi:hypothetical protein